MTQGATGHTVQLGEAVVRIARNEILLGDEIRRVKPKAMIVLRQLVGAKGEVVSKQALMDSAWPRAVVSEGVLTEAIHELRQAFSDDARNPRFIKTIPRVGYCLLPPVSEEVGRKDSGESYAVPRLAVTRFESIGPD